MCKKLLFLAITLVVLAVVGNASAGQDYMWTDQSGIDNPANHGDWFDPCNWLGSLTDANFMYNVPGVNEGAKIAYVGATGGEQPILDANAGRISYFQGGAVKDLYIDANMYLVPGADIYLDKNSIHGNKGDCIWGGTTGAPGTIEMTGGRISGFDNFQIGKRSKGILRMLSGDPLIEGCDNGALKLGNNMTGTGDSQVYLYDGTIYVAGFNWFTTETYLDMRTGGVLISGDSRLGFAGYYCPDMEQYMLDGIQAGVLNCDGGAGEVSFSFSDPHPNWVTVTCESREPLCAAFAAPRGKDITPYDAGCPNPEASAANPTLTWDAGAGATQHDVYMGTDSAAVDTDTGPIYTGAVASHTLSAPLDVGETYYWRVRESNSSGVVCHGDLWTAETSDCLCIDSFEFGTVGWVLESTFDGSVGVVTGTGYGDAVSGTGALRIGYGDTIQTTTTAKLTPATLTNWSVNGSAKALTFYYRAPADAEQIRVQLNTNTAVDISATLDNCWHQANISETALGGGFSSVSTLRIIVMNDTVGDGTGSGIAMIDDVGVCASRCVDATAPVADFTGDCAVDGMDLTVMCGDWLMADADIGTDDINLGDTPDRRPAFVSDVNFGTVLDFDGTNDYFGFDTTGARYANFHDKTVSFWMKREVSGVDNEGTAQIFGLYGVNPKSRNLIGLKTGALWHRYAATMGETTGSTVLTADVWYHVAWVLKDNCAVVNPVLYLNGNLEIDAGEQAQDTNTLGWQTCWVGAPNTRTGKPYSYNGQLAQLRIYDYALSVDEVNYLHDGSGSSIPDAGKLILDWEMDDGGTILYDTAPTPHYGQLGSPANISDAEVTGLKVVNFKDFAMLVNDWGTSALWP